MSTIRNDPQSRRKFLSFGFMSGALLISGKLVAQPDIESGEKVRMLTREGKLVEVDKAVFSTNTRKKPARKKDLLHWIHPNN